MGYETRLYVAHVFPLLPGDDVATARTIVMVDLSATGSNTQTGTVLREAREAAETDESRRFGVYTDDGNTVLKKDCYGKYVCSVPPAALFDALVADNTREPYRRFDLAIRVLSAFIGSNSTAWDNRFDDIKILQYGH